MSLQKNVNYGKGGRAAPSNKGISPKAKMLAALMEMRPKKTTADYLEFPDHDSVEQAMDMLVGDDDFCMGDFSLKEEW